MKRTATIAASLTVPTPYRIELALERDTAFFVTISSRFDETVGFRIRGLTVEASRDLVAHFAATVIGGRPGEQLMEAYDDLATHF